MRTAATRARASAVALAIASLVGIAAGAAAQGPAPAPDPNQGPPAPPADLSNAPAWWKQAMAAGWRSEERAGVGQREFSPGCFGAVERNGSDVVCWRSYPFGRSAQCGASSAAHYSCLIAISANFYCERDTSSPELDVWRLTRNSDSPFVRYQPDCVQVLTRGRGRLGLELVSNGDAAARRKPPVLARGGRAVKGDGSRLELLERRLKRFMRQLRRLGSKRILERGRVAFAPGTAMKTTMRLTRKGRRVLTGKGAVILQIKATFVPNEKDPILRATQGVLAPTAKVRRSRPRRRD